MDQKLLPSDAGKNRIDRKTPDGEKAMKILEKALEKGLIGYMAACFGQGIRFILLLNVIKEVMDDPLGIPDVCMQESV